MRSHALPALLGTGLLFVLVTAGITVFSPSETVAPATFDEAPLDLPASPTAPVAAPPRAAPEARRTAQVEIVGRCLAAGSDRPLTGAELEVRHGQTRTVVTTDTDGRFTARVDGHTWSNRIVVSIATAGRADLAGTLEVRHGRAVAGDLRLAPGARRTVQVEDQHGRHVAAARIHLSRVAVDPPQSLRPAPVASLAPQDAGQHASAGRLAAGVWRLHAFDATGALDVLSPSHPLELSADRAAVRIVLRTRERHECISGRVRSAAGHPIPDAVVQASTATGRPVGTGCSGIDGTFEIHRTVESSEAVLLAVRHATGFEPSVLDTLHPWGATDVELVLQPAGALSVAVVDVAGDPVTAYGVRWFEVAAEDGDRHQRGTRSPADHPDGVVTLPGVPLACIRLVVFPVDRRLAPSAPLEFRHVAGIRQLRVALRPRQLVTIRVVDDAGQPLAGADVELLRPVTGAPVTAATPTVDPSRTAWLGAGAVPVDTGVSRGDGTVTLGGAATNAPLAVRVHAEGWPTAVQGGLVLAEQTGIFAVRLTKGRAFRGRLEPREVLRELGSSPRLLLDHSRGIHRRILPVRADGTFGRADLPPGTWRVRLRAGEARKDLGTIDLGSRGASRTYQIADLQPARIRGQVRVDDAPAARAELQLVRLSPTAERIGTVHSLTTDGAGRFHSGRLSPGRFAATVVLEGVRLAASTALEVTPGADSFHEVRVARGTLWVRLVDREGQPMANLAVEVHDPKCGFRTRATTNARGELRIPKIATGHYTLRTSTDDPNLRLGAMTHAPGRGGQRLEFGVVEVRTTTVQGPITRTARTPTHPDRR